MNDMITRYSTSRLVRRLSPDLVHLHNIMPGLAPLNVAHESGLKNVVTLHTCWPACPRASFVRPSGSICDSSSRDDCRKYCTSSMVNIGHHMKKLQDTLVEKAGVLICVSNYMKQRLLDFGYPAGSLVTIHNGVATPGVQGGYDPANPYELFCGWLVTTRGPGVF